METFWLIAMTNSIKLHIACYNRTSANSLCFPMSDCKGATCPGMEAGHRRKCQKFKWPLEVWELRRTDNCYPHGNKGYLGRFKCKIPRSYSEYKLMVDWLSIHFYFMWHKLLKILYWISYPRVFVRGSGKYSSSQCRWVGCESRFVGR